MNTHFKGDRERATTLEILNTISADSDITQRHLADRLGVALGLANSYLKRCVKKGFVKIQQAPANRYFYYVTPKGFAEKSRLTAEYLTHSFDFYRQASADIHNVGNLMLEQGANKIMFVGVSELAEIGSIRMFELGLSLIGTYDPSATARIFLNKPLWRELSRAESVDACVITALTPRPDLYRKIQAQFEDADIYVPELVRPLLLESGETV